MGRGGRKVTVRPGAGLKLRGGTAGSKSLEISKMCSLMWRAKQNSKGTFGGWKRKSARGMSLDHMVVEKLKRFFFTIKINSCSMSPDHVVVEKFKSRLLTETKRLGHEPRPRGGWLE